MSLNAAPLFRYDCIRLARRWQTYAARMLVLACLLGAMISVWWLEDQRAKELTSGPPGFALLTISPPRPMFAIFDPAHFATQMFFWLSTAQMVLMIVIVPAVTAGAISDEKSRGTLAELLASGLSGPAIILSKLGSRVLWIIMLLGCTAPALYLTALLGGIEPEAILAATLITLCAAILACALALALSVEARQTHEALVMTYFILALLWFVPLLPLCERGWTPTSATTPIAGIERIVDPESLEMRLVPWNPFLAAFLPYIRMVVPWSEQFGFMGRALMLSAIAVIWAAARINRVAVRQVDRPMRRPTPWLQWRALLLRPVLEVNPVMWREWRRRPYSTMGRIMGFVYALFAAGITLSLVLQKSGVLKNVWPTGANQLTVMAAPLLSSVLGAGLLLLSILSVMGLAEDREAGGFEILLTTPMSTRAILGGKWWGACRLVPLVLLTPIAVAIAGNWDLGFFHLLFATLFVTAVSLVYSTAFVTLGLAIAIWIPQTGRAVAMSVGILVFSWLTGWAMAQVLPPEISVGASSLSGWPLVVQAFEQRSWAEMMVEVLPWMFVYGTVTAVLFFVIDMSMYWCVGRMRPVSLSEQWD
jgi:ABC-type transport system involved in multi-copper enzyme maturation permease subunit